MKTLKFWLWGLFLAFIMSTQALAGAWTANEFVYKPALGARGAEEKARFDSGQDRVDTRLSKEIWVGDPKYGSTLSAAVPAIGSSQVILRVPAGTHTISANLAIPANATLKVERGAILDVATTKTLTINGSLEAGDYQVFSWAGTGAIVLSGIHPIKTTWFGDSAAGIAKAIAAIPLVTGNPRPCIVQMPGKNITLESQVTISKCGVDLRGTGINYAGQMPIGGTVLTYLGAGAGIILGETGIFTSNIALRDFALEGSYTGATGLQIGVDATYFPRNLCIDRVLVRCFTSHGVDYRGAIYTTIRQLSSSYNGGAGLKIGGGYSALVKFDTCSFILNLQEGMLISPGAAYTDNFNDVTFDNCDSQGNGYEGLKVVSTRPRSVDNLKVTNCWFESNQLDAGRTSGYYSILLNGDTSQRIGVVTLLGNNFRSVTSMLGTDLVTNGTFTGDSDWTKGANWTLPGTVATHAAGSTAVLEQTLAISANTLYRVSYQVTGRTAGFVTPSLGGRTGATVYADNWYTCAIHTSDTSNLQFTPTSGFDGSIDNVSVKAINNRTLYATGVLKLISRGNSLVDGNYYYGEGGPASPQCVFGAISNNAYHGMLDFDDPLNFWEWNNGVRVISKLPGVWEVNEVSTTSTNVILQSVNIPRRTWSICAVQTGNPLVEAGGGSAQGVRITAQGYKTGTAAKTIELLFGGHSVAAISSSTAAPWRIDATITYKWNAGAGAGYFFKTVVMYDGNTVTHNSAAIASLDVYQDLAVQIKATGATDTVACTVLGYDRF